jgi:hypothetical protein
MTEQELDTVLDFDGETFDKDLDGKRLSRQLLAVKTLMWDGRWRTLRMIQTATGFPEASISARLRDLRKPRFGGFIVERQRRLDRRCKAGGTWEYRLVRNRDLFR